MTIGKTFEIAFIFDRFVNIEYINSMTRLETLMLSALENAESIMDYCAGDAWEREATESDRNKFDRTMQLIRKKLQVGEFSPEAIAKSQREEAARLKEQQESLYWDTTPVFCPLCDSADKKRRSFSRRALVHHFFGKHERTDLSGRKWRSKAQTLFKELGV